MLVVAVGVFAAVVATRDPATRSDLWYELGKGMIQLMVVVGVGALLKFIADAYQARHAKDEALEEFRRDKHRRLVAATATLRKVPILIEANRSVKTWSTQMLAAIETGSELRALRHEIAASNASAEPPFGRSGDQLAGQLKEMVRYVDEWLAADFRSRKDDLSELQREAEQEGISIGERRRLKAQIWKELQQLPAMADMRTAVPHSQKGWGKFLASYEMALDLMTRASLPNRGKPS